MNFPKHPLKKSKTIIPLIILLATLFSLPTGAIRQPKKKRSEDATGAEYRAGMLLERGSELLEQNQIDRAVKILSSIPRLYPKAKTRFKAYLVLARHYVKKKKYEEALPRLSAAVDAESPDIKAEAYYRMGICYFHQGDFDRAFMTLRKVANEYPYSDYANEVYYYIGLCHFKLERWSRAVEALSIVGTRVKDTGEISMLAEAGQRFYIKIRDEDLVVLKENESLVVTATAKSGDQEKIKLEPLGKDKTHYIGSIKTKKGKGKKKNGVLDIVGGDKIHITYIDEHTEKGERKVKKLVQVNIVSTATIGFTDGAYRDYTHGVFGNQDCFLRVKDFDQDTSEDRDAVEVQLTTRYKVKKEKEDASLDFERPDYVNRDLLTVSLKETGSHTGVFTGKLRINVAYSDEEVRQNDDTLSAMKGDDILMEYVDTRHIKGDEPRHLTYKAKVVVGVISDVKIVHRKVDSLELKAKKELIEARIYLKLGNIFKDVGLEKKASEKAEAGLERVESVIQMSTEASLDRSIVEKAFNVKWELLMVQNKLSEAIAVCKSLISLFPDSTLVDRALLDIAQAKLKTEQAGQTKEAIQILTSIIHLPKSDLKAEAQYRIAEVREKMAIAAAKRRNRSPNLNLAMLEYKRCADNYPQSPFAGKALEKIANYYIKTKDYKRAVLLMEQVFQDHPDAGFLDNMLLKWIIASYRLQDYRTAMAKCNQLITDYPNSQAAAKAKKYLPTIQRKLK